MRILVLSSTPREPDNHLLWEGLQQYVEVDLQYIQKDRQRNLPKILSLYDLKSYDRVVLDLLFRHVSRHVNHLKPIAGLVIYEEDGCQNFIRNSRWYRKFSDFYKKIPHVRVICTGFQITQKFRAEGVDAHFLPKGYDSSKLRNIHCRRDIKLGFIGRLASDAYMERRNFLQNAVEVHDLQLLRTLPGSDYRDTLNRISIFLSADIGLGEYMAKNFESMACGCLLMAHRQGNGEEQELGLIDGENAVLYSSADELSKKISWLNNNPEKLSEISSSGQTLAECNFDYLKQSKYILGILSPSTIAPIRDTMHYLSIISRIFRTEQH